MIRFIALALTASILALTAPQPAPASEPTAQAALALALALGDQEQAQQLPAVGVREGWTVQAQQPQQAPAVAKAAKREASDPPDYYGIARADAIKRRKDLIVFVGHLPTIPLHGDYVTAMLESFEGDDRPRTIPSAYAAGQLWRTEPDLPQGASDREIGERLEQLRDALTVRFQPQQQPYLHQQQPAFAGSSYHGGYRAGPGYSSGRASAGASC